MGNIRRVRKSITPKIAMADTHIAINGCRLFLGHPNKQTAVASAKGFGGMLAVTIARAKCLNVSDMYKASLMVRGKMLAGESVCN